MIKRDVHGILLLNKPRGMSSNAALQRVKRLFQARKAGHTGSLDPLASGLLPICLGEATKFSRFLLTADKRYQAVCTLGTTTTTGDAEGEILQQRPIVDIDKQRIETVLAAFRGNIQQIPPMYSALKHQGQALYVLARRHQTVVRAPRWVTVYALELKYLTDKQLALEVHCSKGTYIRTLAEDIGQALGCGAHISRLHRTQVGDHQAMLTLVVLEQQANQGLEHLDRLLLPTQTALAHWPVVTLSATQAAAICQGQTIQFIAQSTPLLPGSVKLLTEQGQFLGIGQILANNRIAPKRLVKL
jgi:tRNA pseudouridine55 synthase